MSSEKQTSTRLDAVAGEGCKVSIETLVQMPTTEENARLAGSLAWKRCYRREENPFRDNHQLREAWFNGFDK